jgi:hypothetical protein
LWIPLWKWPRPSWAHHPDFWGSHFILPFMMMWSAATYWLLLVTSYHSVPIKLHNSPVLPSPLTVRKSRLRKFKFSY